MRAHRGPDASPLWPSGACALRSPVWEDRGGNPSARFPALGWLLAGTPRDPELSAAAHGLPLTSRPHSRFPLEGSPPLTSPEQLLLILQDSGLAPPPPGSPSLGVKLDQAPLCSAPTASWGPAFAVKMLCSHSAARVRGRKLHLSLPRALLSAWPVDGAPKTRSPGPLPVPLPVAAQRPAARLQLTWPQAQGPHCAPELAGKGMLWRVGRGRGPRQPGTQTEPSGRGTAAELTTTTSPFRSPDSKGTKRPGTMILAAPGGHLEVISGLWTAANASLPPLHQRPPALGCP